MERYWGIYVTKTDLEEFKRSQGLVGLKRLGGFCRDIEDWYIDRLGIINDIDRSKDDIAEFRWGIM